MTDLTPDPLDELASAHLDGVTTPEEAARVAADPALQARVEELRAVRDAVARVEPTDGAARAVSVAAVLARLDEGATVTPLAPISRRAGSRTWRIVAAAAAVAAVAVLIPLLTRDDDRSSDQLAAAGDTKTADKAPAAESQADADGGTTAAGGDASPPVAPTTTVTDQYLGALSTLPDLGAFADLGTLEAAVAGQGQEAYATSQDAATYERALPSCANGAPQGAVAIGTARIGGRPVLVLLSVDRTKIAAIYVDTCKLVADVAP